VNIKSPAQITVESDTKVKIKTPTEFKWGDWAGDWTHAKFSFSELNMSFCYALKFDANVIKIDSTQASISLNTLKLDVLGIAIKKVDLQADTIGIALKKQTAFLEDKGVALVKSDAWLTKVAFKLWT